MMYGARQVGKTFILKEFGRNEFENMVYINCYRNEAMQTLFSGDANPERLLMGLSAISEEEIHPQKTFIFLDEVQEIPQVVAALKYFCEEKPDICIAVAGSLLGVLNMKECSFPTGKVDFMHLRPMDYVEFLRALGNNQLADLLKNIENADLINSLMPKLTEYLRQYYFVGGMPEAVLEFSTTADVNKVRDIQLSILAAYEADIAKHAGNEAVRARMIMQSIPSQLARENKKFIFGVVRKGARAANFENAIQWLIDAGMVYKVSRVSKAEMPLNFYKEQDVFKLYLLDVGLLGAMAQAPAAQMLIGDNVFSQFKGAFSENYVLTQMMNFPSLSIGYYSKENSTLEVDFVVQTSNEIMPIEVKAEENVRSKSLRQFVTIDNADSGMIGYRFSMKGFIRQDWMINVPLPAISTFLKSKE